MKLVDPADAPEAAARLEALVGQIPSLLSLEVDPDVLGADGSYDLCLVTTHDSPAGLDDYAQHPLHQDFRSWVGPRLASRAVVDSER